MLKVYTKKHVHIIELGGAKWHISPLSFDEVNALKDKHESVVWDAPKGQQRKERFVQYDFAAITLDRIDKIIKDWEDVVDQDGNELECTRINKLLVFKHNPSIINKVLERADEIAAIEAEERLEQKEEEEGNLESG